MSRKNFIAVAALVILQAVMPLGKAAIGPTLKPTRLGQTIIWRGKKYSAIKSGKKLIWNQGVPIATTSSSSTPSPKASATPTTSGSPTTSTSPSATPTTEETLSGPFPVDVAGSLEVPNGETRIFYPSDKRLKGKGFVITREKSVLIAFDTNCTHETCPVEIGSPNLVCNCHMSYFNRITGNVEGGPASDPLRGYPVKEVAGRIVVTNS